MPAYILSWDTHWAGIQPLTLGYLFGLTEAIFIKSAEFRDTLLLSPEFPARLLHRNALGEISG
ncbi:MAG: hypothetical protein QME51_04950, partial [Planctomycetota bacterium]|nr:hypothetical protein [Planctomycetota bacterium]